MVTYNLIFIELDHFSKNEKVFLLYRYKKIILLASTFLGIRSVTLLWYDPAGDQTSTFLVLLE